MISSSPEYNGLVDENGTPYGVKHIENKIRVSAMPYLFDIAEGNVSGHDDFTKIGYNPLGSTTEQDIWSAGGLYVFPLAEQAMELVSGNNTQDIGTVIKGDATGNTVQADADGTTTSLEDDSVDFTAATAVAVGDCVILDPHGAVPEWGYVTAVAAATLTIANGFSEGGTAASRYYAVIDKSAYTHAQVVKIDYLDGSYVKKEEIIVLNGTTTVATINADIFRINYFHIIAAGSSEFCLGDVVIQGTGAGPEYAHITALYTRERGCIFTVPAGNTLYVTDVNFGAVDPNASKFQAVRMSLRSNMEPRHEFLMGKMFFPLAEVLVVNASVGISLQMPIKIIEKADVTVSGKGFTGFVGPAPLTTVIRGWIE